VNVPKLKEQMKSYAVEHGLPVPRVAWKSNVWGVGARMLAWRVSGHYGKATTDKAKLWRHFNPPTLGERIVAVAAKEVGTTEHPPGSNDGTRVNVYQSSTGAYRAPWCASFVLWVLRQAGYNGQVAPTPAYVPSWTNMIKVGGGGWQSVAFELARPGDLVTLWQSEHIEIVTGRDGDYLTCIGGNTSPVGQNSNGGMVARTRRHRSEVTVIGRAS
jgi:hypothetical protein